MKQFLVLLLVLLPLSFLNSQVTINVPGDYSTIQAAINAANTGDLVLVADGTYQENINFKGKAITVASHFINDPDTSHITNTIIDGSNPAHPDTGSVVLFISGEDTTSILLGFTVTGGTGTRYTAVNGFWLGGGIYIYGASPKIKKNIIENNVVSANMTSFGAAIFAQTNIPDRICIVEDNTIRNNLSKPIGSTAQGAGAVQLWYTTNSTIVIRNNYIYDNVVVGDYDLFGGGIAIGASENNNQYVCIVENNMILDNEVTDIAGSSYQWGGGIYIQDVNAIIRNNIIAYNSAEDGGGIYYLNTQTTPSVFPIVDNNTIFGNTISSGGYGGALNTNREYYINNCIIWGNSSPQFYADYAIINYSNIEELYLNGSHNITVEPGFVDLTYFCLCDSSECIDAGNPDPTYNDVEDPQNPGNPLPPAQGTLRNDMGHVGGPASLWGYWEWPIPVELTSFTATSQLGKVILNWATATEINNLGFEIERASFTTTPGQEKLWRTIGFVPGKGTTSEPQEYSYVDDISEINATSLVYRLKQMDFLGTYEYSEEVFVENPAPVNYVLYQNYPNPFNPTTTITFGIPIKTHVVLKIFNAVGEEVAQLYNGEREAGRYTFEFNAEGLPSGIYFYQLRTGEFVQTKKMLLIK